MQSTRLCDLKKSTLLYFIYLSVNWFPVKMILLSCKLFVHENQNCYTINYYKYNVCFILRKYCLRSTTNYSCIFSVHLKVLILHIAGGF